MWREFCTTKSVRQQAVKTAWKTRLQLNRANPNMGLYSREFIPLDI